MLPHFDARNLLTRKNPLLLSSCHLTFRYAMVALMAVSLAFLLGLILCTVIFGHAAIDPMVLASVALVSAAIRPIFLSMKRFEKDSVQVLNTVATLSAFASAFLSLIRLGHLDNQLLLNVALAISLVTLELLIATNLVDILAKPTTVWLWQDQTWPQRVKSRRRGRRAPRPRTARPNG